jgi:hypothetical protein
MSDSSKGRGQTKYSPWSSRFGVGRGANDLTPKNYIVRKLWRSRATQGCSAIEEENYITRKQNNRNRHCAS